MLSPNRLLLVGLVAGMLARAFVPGEDAMRLRAAPVPGFAARGVVGGPAGHRPG